jgi:hypothetical protein
LQKDISAISWQSVLSVEETGEPGENHWPATSHWQTLLHNAIILYSFLLFKYTTIRMSHSLIYSIAIKKDDLQFVWV